MVHFEIYSVFNIEKGSKSWSTFYSATYIHYLSHSTVHVWEWLDNNGMVHHLLIIQPRECDLVINGNYFRKATYGKLIFFFFCTVAFSCSGPCTKLMGTSGKFNIFTALIDPKVGNYVICKVSLSFFHYLWCAVLHQAYTNHRALAKCMQGCNLL